MNANQMKHAANLAEWKQRIIECRASGEPVKTWCKNNDCNPSTYYRWEREIFSRIKKTTAEDSDASAGRAALLPAPKHDLVEVPVGESGKCFSGIGRSVIIQSGGGHSHWLHGGFPHKLGVCETH